MILYFYSNLPTYMVNYVALILNILPEQNLS